MTEQAEPNREIALSEKKSGKDGWKLHLIWVFISNYKTHLAEVLLNILFCIAFVFYNFTHKSSSI